MALEVRLRPDCECIATMGVTVKDSSLINGLLIRPGGTGVSQTLFAFGHRMDIINCTKTCSERR